MTSNTQLNEIMTGDPVAFSIERLGFIPDDIQKSILRSDERNIICNMHRQFGKTSIIALKAMHHAMYHADSLSVIACPTEDQSKEMLRKVYLWLKWSDTPLKEASKSFLTMEHNDARIVALSGSERTVRGKSAPDLVIVDEASRVLDEMFVALSPMLMMSQGQLILISTPHGKQGEYYRYWTHYGEHSPGDWDKIEDEWQRFQITAEQNDRIMSDPERRAWLDNEKNRLSDRAYRQEYECEFVEAEDNAFSYDHIHAAVDKYDPLFGDNMNEADYTPIKV